jgi:hypothetical protein
MEASATKTPKDMVTAIPKIVNAGHTTFSNSDTKGVRQNQPSCAA